MSYKLWHNSTERTYAGTGYSFDADDGFPLDGRTLRDSFADIVDEVTGVVADARYPGLKVYTEDNKEYVFTITNNKRSLANTPLSLKEYHPELAHFSGDTNNATVPSESADLISALGGSITVDDTVYNVIPEGAEGTYKTSDGKYYKFVWNGSAWVRFSGTEGSGTVSGPITSSDITDASDDPETDNYPENVCITKGSRNSLSLDGFDILT